ncbi:Sodium/glucose cotransporter [Symmachiella dynata]|uniref:Sodium/glucose cotransporter n=1 Tax=Symmachiella dynata TaxID=2527995 RepID=A0A517ZYK3_9PLAN|nr:sodium:solute symporter [Symmachiella dynata]QDU47574.1 Sodium/glucose cotransporter [Symmachiella dynata]
MPQLFLPVFAELPAADIAVLVVYIIGIVAFGCGFIRKSGSTSEFMAAGGSLPGWAVGLSIFGTYLSSNTFLGVPGIAYGSNWNGWVFSLSLPFAAVIAVKYFVPFYRRSGEISAYQHFEKRFGGWARTYCVTFYLLTQFARVGSVMFGVALGLRALTGWDMQAIIIGTGFLVTLYTLLGGIEAVIWTDVAQSIVLSIGAVIVAGLILFDLPEGPGQVFTIAAEHEKFSLGSFETEFATSTFWVMLLYGVFINLNNFGIDQNFVQRYHTAKSEKEAARSVWMGAIAYVPISLLFFFIGSSLFSYYETQPEMKEEVQIEVAPENLKKQANKLKFQAQDLAYEESRIASLKVQDSKKYEEASEKHIANEKKFQVNKTQYEANKAALEDWTTSVQQIQDDMRGKNPDLTDEEFEEKFLTSIPNPPEWVTKLKASEIGDKVFPHFIVAKLPVGMAGLLLAAIFAAAMSSVDTSLNSSATVILTDIYKRYINPDVDEKGQMRVLYGSTLFVGAVGTGIGVALIGTESILKAWWTLSGIFAGGMLGLFLLSLIARNATKPAAATGVVIGLLVIMWMTFSDVKFLRETLGIPYSLPEGLRSPFHGHMTIVVGTLTIFLVGLIISQFVGGKTDDAASNAKT